MDEPIYLFSARLLSFLAGFLLVLGIKFFLTNRKKNGPWSDSRLPFTFRGFPNEIKLFKDTIGTGLRQRFPAKGAKHTAVDANIGIIYLTVDHIRGNVAMHAATHMVRQRAHGGNIRAGKQRQPVGGAQPLAFQHLVADGRQAERGVIRGI